MKTLSEEIAESKRRQKEIRQRRKELNQKHNQFLDWLIGIDDNFVFGNDVEATEFIKTLNGYAEKLAALLKYRQQRILDKRKTRNVQ